MQGFSVSDQYGFIKRNVTREEAEEIVYQWAAKGYGVQIIDSTTGEIIVPRNHPDKR